MQKISLLLSLLLMTVGLMAQNLTLPQASPKAKLDQMIGLTELSVEYSRPQVKGRKIFGGIVPMDQIWRAGANDNTVFSVSEAVKIAGKSLPAGTYGLHMIPSEGDWTLIFSSNHTSWGSFFYKKEEDVLRVQLSPRSCSHHEVLTYDIVSYANGEATLAMRWAEMEVPIPISVDMQEQTLSSMRRELRNLPGFSWQGYNQAANYCAQNNINHEEALAWADQAIQRGRNFNTLATKSRLLAQTGETAASGKVMDEALTMASNTQLNAYGYSLMNAGNMDKAIDIFTLNTERNPEDPNVWDSLGEGLVNRNQPGDKKAAIKALKKSLSLNPPANVSANSKRLLEQIGG